METQIKKRAYGRLDSEILVQALGQGMSNIQAGRLAGSRAKNDMDVSSHVSKVLKKPKNTKEKKTIIELLAEKQRRILESIKDTDFKNAPLNQKTIALGIITDKLQLLKGDPTERIETIPRMVISNTPQAKPENPINPLKEDKPNVKP